MSGAPPLLLAAALAFWAQQTGLWILAGLLIAIVIGGRLTQRRWDLKPQDFHRVGDLCTLIFAAVAVYFYMTQSVAKAAIAVLAWLPASLLPLIAAQELSAQGRLDLGALFWSLRGAKSGAQTIDVSYPYFAACLLSAAAANTRSPAYYAGMFALCAAALWRFRSPAWPLARWSALVAVAGVLGWAGQAGLAGLQVTLERSAMNALFNGDVPMDPYQTRTAMGQIGALQQSGDVALRISSDGKPPALLRTSSYNHYANAQWFARDPGFRSLGADGGLADAREAGKTFEITASWPRGEGVLALPVDAARVDGLSGASLTRNRLGAVKVSGVPGAVRYRVSAAAGADRDAPPDSRDLEIPDEVAPLFARLARKLELAGKKPDEISSRVARFFADGFRYTIFQGKSSPEPLEDFLEKTRAGHCEYFASSTVLLLRAAGVPARYATGYSVQEYSKLERVFVVRQRHAHAWALVWLDGRWRDLDTTPLSWPEIENGRASWMEPLSDLAGALSLRFSLWRQTLASSTGGGRLSWLLLGLLVLWIFWKASAFLNASRKDGARAPKKIRVIGADSEFYRVEERLSRAGLARQPWEAQNVWLDRIAPELGAARSESLRNLLTLHCRYRFDPAGVSEAERRALREGANGWITEFSEPAPR